MRIFEILSYISLLVMITAHLIKGTLVRKVSAFMPYLSLILFILHYAVEGIRWQMYPVYAIMAVYLAAVTVKLIKGQYFKEVRLVFSKKAPAFLLILLTLVSAGAAWAFPVNSMVKPDGPYKIGTVSYEFKDPSRIEQYDSSGSSRRIMVQLWYPADGVSGLKRAPWLENGDVVAPGVSRMMHFPGFVLSHMSLVKSNSYFDALISEKADKYPVIILSHGWTGFKNLHTDIAEMLASHGYIVAAIDHTYGSSATVFKNGDTAYLNRKALPGREETDDFLIYASALVNTYAGDISLTLDQLEKLNSGDIDERFRGRLDTARIGILGHSTGGGASVKTAILDRRIKAVIGLDAWVEPVDKEIIGRGLSMPGLFLRSQQWEEGLNNENLFKLLRCSSGSVVCFQIDGTRHNDFTMAYMFSPLSSLLNMTGSMDGWDSSAIQREYILDFFEKYVKGQEAEPVEEVSSRHPEIKLLYDSKR